MAGTGAICCQMVLADDVALPDRDGLSDAGGRRGVLVRLLVVPLQHAVIDEVARMDAGATTIGDDQGHDVYVLVFAVYQQYRLVDLQPPVGMFDVPRSYG